MSIIERKLKESEERFKALFKGGPVPTYAWQKFENSFKLIDYNIAAENITQGNVEKFLGVAASEMYKSRPEIVKDLNISFNEKKNIIREMKYSFSSSEEVKDLLVTYSYIPPDLVLVHTEDVTQSKRAEEKLKESEQRYRSLFNNMNAGFAYHKVITDDNNTPIDYEYIEVNPAFEKFTGLKAKEMIGKKVTEVLPGTENDPADWIGKFGNVGLTGVPLVVEDYSEALDRWYRVSGYSPKKGYFAVTFTEITDQKKTQLKLADSEEKYRKLYNNAPFAIVLFSLDGIILDCNDSTKRITGYSKEDLAGKNFKDFNFYVEPDLANIKEREDQVKNGKIPGVRDILLKKKDGSEFWAKTQIEFVSMGDITYIQAIIQDVSEEKLAQIKLNKSENLLKEKVKELNCLYELSKIGEKLDVSLNEIMNEFLNLIQNAWQFPALICARISFEGKSYTTENFNETLWLLDSQVEINKKPLVINVYYLQDNPFFDEEKDLLKEIGIRVKIILERKESEERLRESEEKYRKVIEQSQDGVVLVDEDAEIIEWNKAQEKIFGKKKDEVLGKKLWEVQYEAIPKDSRSQEIMEQNKKSIIEAIKTGKAPWINVLQEMITIDTKGKHHIIQQIPYLIKTANNYMLGSINRDVTELKEAELKLRESEEKFRSIFETIPDLYFQVSSDTTIIDYKGTMDDLYAPPEDFLGKKIVDVLPHDVAKISLNSIEKTLDTHKPQIAEYSLNMKGELRYFEARYLYFSENNVLVFIRDITERREAEDKLLISEKNAKEAFDRANFYKDLFAHDMNNILQVVNSSAELISYQLGDSEKSKDIANIAGIIKKQVERGAKLISNVRTLSELEDKKIVTSKTQIKEYLMGSIDFVKKAYQDRNLSISIEGIKDNYFTNANELLQDVFENVLINGIRYNENTNIEIAIEVTEQKIDDKNYIRLEFKDNGIGVDDARKELIFKRGNREIKGSKGMGLGLSLVSKILEIFKAKIWVEDRVQGVHGKGSNFIIVLPKTQNV